MSEMDMEAPEYKAKQLRFEYSTDELIAELERRRPCKKCGNDKAKDEPVDCIFCRWSNENISRPDNFKEAPNAR